MPKIQMAVRNFASDGLDVWLVWCFEHCLKREHEQVQKELMHLATSLGVKFVCHKKAAGFLSWLDGRAGTMLIIADWRETKPIVKKLSERSNRCILRMCVVGRSEKMLRNASLFAGRQSTGAEILVTSSFSCESVEEFIRSYVQAARETTKCAEIKLMSLPLQTKPIETLPWLSLPGLLESIQDPETAGMLEQLIRQTMWQVYED
ncbi:unnamed protein product [Symbiodinium natans]|uniref:Uncharacterized protein n=1 Tax=Symbiodinium natans TaxID=878477 RepID=A0A812TTK5_9DINO|nr:unnamed protein product [Symbiodinium natans]